MASRGKWTTRVAYLYYVAGSIYYVYHLVFILGIVAGLAVFFDSFPVLRYSAPAISIASLWAGVAFWRRQVSFQLNGPNPSLRFDSVELLYKEIDSANCEAERTACVKAVYPVDHYLHKFAWSGHGEIVPEVISGAARAELAEPHSGNEQACRIYFERSLNKKEARKFSYRLKLKNGTKPLKHYLGHRLDTPCKKLVMKVMFSQQFKPTRGAKQVFVTERSEIPLWEEHFDLTVNQTGLLWEIKQPRNGYFYRISWC